MEELKLFSCFKEGQPCRQIFAADVRAADEMTGHAAMMFIEGDMGQTNIRNCNDLAMQVPQAVDLSTGDKCTVVIGNFVVKDLKYLDTVDFGETGELDQDDFFMFSPTESPETTIIYTYAALTGFVAVNGKPA